MAPTRLQIGAVLTPIPLFAVVPPAFPFPALAARAGVEALGGAREAVMAVFVAARLVHDALESGSGAVPPSLRVARARGARAWLGALAVPAGVRGPAGKLIDASAGDDRTAMLGPLTSVIIVTAAYLDPASRSELDRLAQALVA